MELSKTDVLYISWCHEKSPNEESPSEKSLKETSPKEKSPKKKSPKEKSPKEKSPKQKSPKLKNRAKSGQDCPLQVYGIENIAPNNVVRFG